MILHRNTDRAIVQCDQCPGRPVLPTHLEDIDTRRCVRCQGEHRWLPQPHPEDHLCTVCRRECPVCQAVTDQEGRPCRGCQGRCRTCSAPLSERPASAEATTRVEPDKRKDKHRRWTRTYYPRAWDQCDACQRTATTTDPVRAVLSALPGKLLRACGGGVPPAVVQTVRDELLRQSAARLIARIERRWWTTWANRPLEREADAGEDGYRPDDVAVWLLAATSCAGRCEDGWHPAPADRPTDDDQPCGVCRGGWLLPGHGPDRHPDEDDARPDDQAQAAPTATNRTPAQAVAYRPPHRECEGRGGTCGRPVTDPYTQCPSCLGWPRCACGAPYDPARGDACRTCRLDEPV
ncbi:hypothetical protein ACFZCY_21365 [Streptomyces sp. NPDC007983]|uniref:hypothetical protein n=1 Tax=Streptomyces sp. NPDC007983 TaxID=3364800 RepID=UPI0036F0C84F